MAETFNELMRKNSFHNKFIIFVLAGAFHTRLNFSGVLVFISIF